MNPPKFEEAHEDYEKALDIAPHNAKLWHSKGLAYQAEAERIKSDRELMYELDREDERHPDNLNEKAIESYVNALRLQENFVSSRFHLGLMYHRTNQPTEALKCFSKVLVKIKDDSTVYVARGIVYYDMGNHAMAI